MRTLWLLFSAELLVLATDITLNVLLIVQNYLARQMVQAFTEVLKLKIEFIVLNSLVEYSQSKAHRESTIERHGEVDFITRPGEQIMGATTPPSSGQIGVQDVEAGPSMDQSNSDLAMEEN